MVKVGQQDLQIERITKNNGNGWYSGEGSILMPYIGMPLAVKFDNIYINTNYEVTQGRVDFISTISTADLLKNQKAKASAVDQIQKWKGKIPDPATSSLPELIDFAIDFVAIPEASINGTLVLNASEKDQVTSAQKIVAKALEVLNDPNASADDKKAAENKLRETVKDNKATLDKFVGGVGNGMVNVVGDWFKNIRSFLNGYKGTSSDQQQAVYWHRQTDSAVVAIRKRTDVPDTLMLKLNVAYEAAIPAWAALEKGSLDIVAYNDVKHGPHLNDDLYYMPGQAQDIANQEVDVIEEVNNSLLQPRVFCVSADKVTQFQTSIFFNPNGEPVDIGNAIPLSFYSSKEKDVDLSGRLFAFTKNGNSYYAALDKDGKAFIGYVAINPSNIDKSQYAPLGIKIAVSNYDVIKPSYGEVSKAQLVINDNDCNISVRIAKKEVASFVQQKCNDCNALSSLRVAANTPKGDPHVASLIVKGMTLAADLVNSMKGEQGINSETKNTLAKSITAAGFTSNDATLVQKAAENYYKGFDAMKWWSNGDFTGTYNNVVKDSKLNNFSKIDIVDSRIQTSLKNQLNIISQAGNVAIFISSLALFPEVGDGPRAPYSSSTQQEIVDIATKAGPSLENVVDEVDFIGLTRDVKYLPGPQLPERISSTFEGKIYSNRKLSTNETFYKYHGVDNRTGRKYAWYTNKKYSSEIELRQNLAIREDWGVQIEYVSEFDVPSGTWVSEGKAAAQGVGYPGQGYQAVITNTPTSWIIRTDKAFK